MLTRPFEQHVPYTRLTRYDPGFHNSRESASRVGYHIGREQPLGSRKGMAKQTAPPISTPGITRARSSLPAKMAERHRSKELRAGASPGEAQKSKAPSVRAPPQQGARSAQQPVPLASVRGTVTAPSAASLADDVFQKGGGASKRRSTVTGGITWRIKSRARGNRILSRGVFGLRVLELETFGFRLPPSPQTPSPPVVSAFSEIPLWTDAWP